MRVLKPTGSIWVNLGDKYSADPSGPAGHNSAVSETQKVRNTQNGRRRVRHGIRSKSLIGLPWRYALRCIDDLGLILRAEVIWEKSNGLPESVTDRVRRSHETWFHLVKSPRYFAAVDAIRETYSPNKPWGVPSSRSAARAMAAVHGDGTGKQEGLNASVRAENPLRKLPGSVWEIATEPLTVPDHLGVDHFAAFPMEWPRQIILGWSPSGICTACGAGRRPVVDRTNRPLQRVYNGSLTKVPGDGRKDYRTGVPQVTEATITGEACACPDTSAPTRPAIVLDVFGGTGTTALVAETLGRRGVSVDMSADYLRIAAWRITDPGQRAKALGVPKPPPVAVGQLDLFGGTP